MNKWLNVINMKRRREENFNNFFFLAWQQTIGGSDL
jgi:hypothetical protein